MTYSLHSFCEANTRSSEVIQKKLENIEHRFLKGKFLGKKLVLLESNLEVRSLGLLGRALWFIAKRIEFLRKKLFNVQNNEARRNLDELLYEIRRIKVTDQALGKKLEDLLDRIVVGLDHRELKGFKKLEGIKRKICPGVWMQTYGSDLTFDGELTDEHLKALFQKLQEYGEAGNPPTDTEMKLEIRFGLKEGSCCRYDLGSRVVVTHYAGANDYTVNQKEVSAEEEMKTDHCELDQAVKEAKSLLKPVRERDRGFLPCKEVFTAVLIGGGAARVEKMRSIAIEQSGSSGASDLD